jgi:site-specific DNA recombinase
VESAIEFAQNMPSRWLKGDFVTKQHLQYLVYPSGLFYDKRKDECRTFRVNSLFLYIAHLKQIIEQKKGKLTFFWWFFLFVLLGSGSRTKFFFLVKYSYVCF